LWLRLEGAKIVELDAHTRHIQEDRAS